MFVITADQIDSRHGADRVDDALAQITGSPAIACLPRPHRGRRTTGDHLGCRLRARHPAGAGPRRKVERRHGRRRRAHPAPGRHASGERLRPDPCPRGGRGGERRRPAAVISVDPDRSPDAPTLQAVLDLLLHSRERRSVPGMGAVRIGQSAPHPGRSGRTTRDHAPGGQQTRSRGRDQTRPRGTESPRRAVGGIRYRPLKRVAEGGASA